MAENMFCLTDLLYAQGDKPQFLEPGEHLGATFFPGQTLSRVMADERDILDAKVKRAVEQELFSVIPEERPGDFNQAMMEKFIEACEKSFIISLRQCCPGLVLQDQHGLLGKRRN